MSDFPTPDEVQDWLHQEEQDGQEDGEACAAYCANCPHKDTCELKRADLDEFLAVDEIGLRIKPAPEPLPEDVFDALRRAIAVSLVKAMQDLRKAAGASGLRIKFDAEVTAFVLQASGEEKAK